MKNKFTTTLDKSVIAKIKIQAVKENRSVGDIIDELLIEYLNNKGVEYEK